MLTRLAILFIVIPLVELYLLFQLNTWTGSPITTICLILFTGVLGAWLAKQQGLSTISRIQQALTEGRMPTKELVDGGMILFAGALLLTPGILTDAFGFSLLIPPCRAVYRRLLKRLFPPSNIQFHMHGQTSQQDSYQDDLNVIDGTATPSKDQE